MMSNVRETIRSTQRVPRSCSFCYKRKIKCDQQIPCKACRSRGQATSCHIETVLVKGRVVKSGRSCVAQPSYEDLVRDNERLQALLHMNAKTVHIRRLSSLQLMDEREQELYKMLRSHYRPSSLSGLTDILYPSEDCSPRCKNADPSNATDASWLALYFSYLTTALMFSRDDDLFKSGLPHDDIAMVRRNWYDAALFFLHRSDFLRAPDIRSIQTIAILGVVFINFGDFNLYYNLWGCAVRIAQSLELNNDSVQIKGHEIEPQMRSRLWWSLVISDWLSFQLGHACIREDEFMVELPSIPPPVKEHPNSEPRLEEPNILQYHIVMSKIASSMYRFQSTNSYMAGDWDTTMQLVRNADNNLADVIAHLPPHLQPSEIEEGESNVSRQHAYQPWISHQKRSLSVVLFYYRMVITRVQKKHQECPDSMKGRATLVCLDSAHAIVKAYTDPEQSDCSIPVWSVLLPLYSAASTLAVEWAQCGCGTEDRHLSEVVSCIGFFDALAYKSVYATYASQALRGMIVTSS